MPRHRGEAAAESRHCLRRCCCARAREAAIVRAASAWPRNCGRPSEAQPAIVLAPTVLVRVRVRVRVNRPSLNPDRSRNPSPSPSPSPNPNANQVLAAFGSPQCCDQLSEAHAAIARPMHRSWPGYDWGLGQGLGLGLRFGLGFGLRIRGRDRVRDRVRVDLHDRPTSYPCPCPCPYPYP